MTTLLRLPTAAEAFTEDEVLHTNKLDWFHVYSTENYPDTKPDTFNEGWGASRFAPLFQADGTPVHTYYIASTIECAVMESVLHDVPLHPAGTFELDRLRYFHLVRLQIPYDLKFVSFHTPYCRKCRFHVQLWSTVRQKTIRARGHGRRLLICSSRQHKGLVMAHAVTMLPGV